MNTEDILESIPKTQESKPDSVRNIVLENDMVRVVVSSYVPGGSVPMHTHSFPHVLYVIEGSKVETTGEDGNVTVMELHPGLVQWREAQSHSTRNIGSTPLRIVEVEIKIAPSHRKGERTPRIALAGDLEWMPDPLDPTRKTALLSGDPTRPGPYTVRSKVGADYQLGLHMHPNEDENLTVLSGALHWSTGEKGSGAPEHILPAGSYVQFPAGTPHRLWTTEETEIQMTGIGPRTYEYFNKKDDRRTKF